MEIEVIEYTTTTSSKKEVIETKAPIISGKVVEMGSRVKQSEVRFEKKNCTRLRDFTLPLFPWLGLICSLRFYSLTPSF